MLQKLACEGMVRGLLHIDHLDQLCNSCLAWKQRHLTFLFEEKYRAENKLELVHGNLCGPVTLATPSGNKLFLLVDDLSHYIWLVLLSSKDQAADAIVSFQASAKWRPEERCAPCALTTAASSRRTRSSSTAPGKESRSTSPLRTRPNRIGWSRGGIKW